jgi:hypothetical protein
MRITFRNLAALALVGVSFFLVLERAAAIHHSAVAEAPHQAPLGVSLANPVESYAKAEGFWELSPESTLTSTLTYTVQLPLVLNNYSPPIHLQKRIDNITAFLEQCPTNDPAYSRILSDFTIRIDGAAVENISCTEPISEIPINQFTQELITAQVLRTIYYMDPGVPDYLPWTPMSLYDWMASNIGGINLKTAPGNLYCCEVIEGRKYIVQSIQSDDQREYKRYWPGISGSIDFFAHEVRHADGGHWHVTGCEAFPNPTDPAGCDESYDLSNLGSHGVQYWLNASWMTGYLNVGISCNSAEAYKYISWHLASLNQFRRRFVNNVPPLAEMPEPPYGGPCYDQ